MRIGFLGTGTISSAVIRGLLRKTLTENHTAAGAHKPNIEGIFITSRSTETAVQLARDFSCVHIVKNNQTVVDNADWIFVAVPASVCEKALRVLSFSAGQKLISFVPNPSCAELTEWTGGKPAVFRAMPLPFIAEHKIATPLFPADKDVQSLFAAAGGVIVTENEAQFNLFMTAGSLMGVYYRFCGLCAAWLRQKGLPAAQAQSYMVQLFAALAEAALHEKTGNKSSSADGSLAGFAALQREYSTKGGTNELIAKAFDAKGGADALLSAIEAGFTHIKGE